MSARVYKSGSADEPRLEEPVTLVRHDVLQMTDIGDNNNKFFSLELHQSGASAGRACIYTHYGRVGDAGRRETRYFDSLGLAKIAYNALHAQKTKKGYEVVHLQSSSIGSPLVQAAQSGGGDAAAASSSSGGASMPTNNVPSQLSAELQAIVNLLYDEAAATLSDTIAARITSRGVETPLGVLTLAQVSKGERVLDQIHSALQRESGGGVLEQLSAQFYTIVPHTVGRSKSAISSAVIRTAAQLEEKQELVQLMRDLVSVSSSVGGSGESALVDQRYAALRCTIESVTNTGEGRRIAEQVEASQRATRSLRVVNVYRIARPSEVEDFTTLIENKKLLFHGSRASNMVGILSRGLLEPKRIIARGGQRTNFGWLGAGIYFGDAACTSVKYAHPAANGNRFLLVANVALGKSAQYTKITADLDDAPPGFNSAHGVRRTPERASDFDDDEFVVYRRDQQRLSYLVEFSVDANDVRAVQVAPSASAAATTTPAAAAAAPAPAAAAAAPRMTAKAKLEELKRARAAAPSAAPSAFAAQPSSFAGEPFGFATSTEPVSTFQTVSSFAQPSQFAQPTSTFSRGVATAAATSSLAFSVAAASSSSSSSSSSSPSVVTGLSAADAKIKQDEDELRRLFVSDRANARISNPHVHLIDVYADDGRSMVYEERNDLPLVLTQLRRKGANGAAAVVNRAQFERKWAELTSNALARINWSNVFVAGGAVLACMLPEEESGAKDRFADTDIDMFLYGLDDQAAVAKLRHIYDCVVASCGETQVVRTGNAVTIIGGFPRRHIQLVLRLYKSPAEVLLGFDIDACAVGYDGRRVWAVPRSRRAIVQRRNIVDMSRRSLTYEVRLYKYAKRGFAVAVPGFDRRLVDFAAIAEAARHPTQAKGLLRLLALEWAQLDKATGLLHQRDAQELVARRIAGEPPTSADNRILEFAAEAAREHGADESDYSDVFLPWGPQWMAARVIKMLEKRDRASMFSVRNPATGKVHHRHTFVSGIENVISGRSLWCKLCRMSAPKASAAFAQGPLAWVTENPGRQLLTGSFHPVDNEQWYDGALLNATSAKLTVARAIGSLRAAESLKRGSVQLSSAPTRRAISPLHWAAALGDLATVQELLRSPHALAIDNSDVIERIPPLTLAAMNGHLAVAQALLANPKTRADEHEGIAVYPLVAAAYYGATDLVQLLLPTGGPALRRTASDGAQSQGHGAIAQLLGAVGAAKAVVKPSAPALDSTARLEYPLLACAYDLDVRALESAALNGVTQRDAYGVTALHVIAARIAPDDEALAACVASLLARGADPNAQDVNGSTPLHYAAQCGNTRMVVELLQAKARTDVANVVGHTPLDVCSFGLAALLPFASGLAACFPTSAVHAGHVAIRKLLRDAGAVSSASAYDVPSLPPSLFIKTHGKLQAAAPFQRASKVASASTQPFGFGSTAPAQQSGGFSFGNNPGFGSTPAQPAFTFGSTGSGMAMGAPTAAPSAFGGFGGFGFGAAAAAQPTAAPHAFGQVSQAPFAAPSAFGAFGTPAPARINPGMFGTPATAVASAAQGGLFGTPVATNDITVSVMFESKSHSFTLPSVAPVSRLKALLSRETEVGTAHINLTFNGMPLNDDAQLDNQVGEGAQLHATRDTDVKLHFNGKLIAKVPLTQTFEAVVEAVRRAQPQFAPQAARFLWRGAELSPPSSQRLAALGFDANSPPIIVSYRQGAATANASAFVASVAVEVKAPTGSALSLGQMSTTATVNDVRVAYEANGRSAVGGTFGFGAHKFVSSETLADAMRRVGHNVAQPFRLDLTFAHAMAPAPSTPSAPRQTTLATTSAGGLGWKPSTPAVAAATPTASSPGFGWQSATTPVRPGFQAPTKAAAAAVAWGAPQANAAWGAPQADAARTSVAVPTTTAPATTAAAVDLTGTRTPVAKLLLLVSHLFKRGSLTPAQRAALKQRVMSGDPALLAVLECFEVDADLGELLDSMRALSSQ